MKNDLIIQFRLYKLMIRLNRFAFSTIALISGGPKYDQQLASIAATLQNVSKGSASLVGVVGSPWESSLSKTYASSNLLDKHQFEVNRTYITYHEDIQDSFLMPYRTLTHYKNFKLVKQLEKQHFFQDIFANNVSAIATVGNFSLSLRIGEKLNAYCKAHGKVRPYTAFFHRQVTERTVANEQFLDFQYYNVQKGFNNASGYIFPSFCVGYDGLYKAFQHLQTFKKDPSNDSFISENFSFEVSELVRKSRSNFRSQRGISQDKYVIYIDAGKTAEEVKFSFKAFKDGLNQFFSNGAISTINASHFEFFVNIPSGKAGEEIKSKLGYLPSSINTTLIEEQDKYAALCASDFGLFHNGEATVQAAAVQLPILVVDSMSNVHAYFNNLFNGHASPLNIATNYEAYQDLCGSLTAFGGKIGSIILKNFQTPKLRYYYAKLYRQQIQKILSKSNTNTKLSVSETGLQTGCKHLLEKAQIYDKISGSTFRKQRERKEALTII